MLLLLVKCYFFFKHVIYVCLGTQKAEAVLLCSSAPVTDAVFKCWLLLSRSLRCHADFHLHLICIKCAGKKHQQFSGSSPCLVCSGKLLQFTQYLWEAKIHCYARVKILSSGLYSGPEQSTHISSFIRDRCLWD